MPHNMPGLNYFTVLLYHLTGERAYRGSADRPVGFLKLITTGRKTGKQRRVHLVYLRDGSAYVVTVSPVGGGATPAGFSICTASHRPRFRYKAPSCASWLRSLSQRSAGNCGGGCSLSRRSTRGMRSMSGGRFRW